MAETKPEVKIDLRTKQKKKNYVILGAIIVYMAVMFVVTIVKMSG